MFCTINSHIDSYQRRQIFSVDVTNRIYDLLIRMLRATMCSFFISVLLTVVFPAFAVAQPVDVGAAMPGGSVAWKLPANTTKLSPLVVDDALFVVTDTALERYSLASNQVEKRIDLLQDAGDVCGFALDDYTLYVVYTSGEITAFSIDLEQLWQVNIFEQRALLEAVPIHIVDICASHGKLAILTADNQNANMGLDVFQSVDGKHNISQSIDCTEYASDTFDTTDNATQIQASLDDNGKTYQIVGCNGAWVILNPQGFLIAVDDIEDKNSQARVQEIELPQDTLAQSICAAADMHDGYIYSTTTAGTLCQVNVTNEQAELLASPQVFEFAYVPSMLARNGENCAKPIVALEDACLVQTSNSAGATSLYLCTQDNVEMCTLDDMKVSRALLISTDMPSFNVLLCTNQGIFMVDILESDNNILMGDPTKIADGAFQDFAVGEYGEMVCVDMDGSVSMVMPKGASTPAQNSDMMSRLMGPGTLVLIIFFGIYFFIVLRGHRPSSGNTSEGNRAHSAPAQDTTHNSKRSQ